VPANVKPLSYDFMGMKLWQNPARLREVEKQYAHETNFISQDVSSCC